MTSELKHHTETGVFRQHYSMNNKLCDNIAIRSSCEMSVLMGMLVQFLQFEQSN